MKGAKIGTCTFLIKSEVLNSKRIYLKSQNANLKMTIQNAK